MAMNDPLARLARARERVDAFEATRRVPEGVLTPRQRVDALVDNGSFLELGRLTTSQQPGLADDTPADGLVAGWATIGGREVGVLAEDPIAAARTDGQVARNKRLRVVNTCAIRGNPVVLLADGQAEPAVFEPATGELYGFMGRQWPEAGPDAAAAPAVTVVFGHCTGRIAELAVAGDVLIVTPAADLASFADATAPDDTSAIALVSALFAALTGGGDAAPPGRALADDDVAPRLDAVIDGLFDRASVLRLTDRSTFATGVAALDGRAVVFAAAGGGTPLGAGELRAISRAARLARRAVLPLLLVQDTAGYERGEHVMPALAEALREVQAVHTPKLTLVTGRGHVLGTFVLGGRQLGIDLAVALPTAQVAALDVPSYVPGSVPDVDGPWLAAGLGHVDEVVAPSEARRYLGAALALLDHGRVFPTPEADRAGRYIDDIPKV